MWNHDRDDKHNKRDHRDPSIVALSVKVHEICDRVVGDKNEGAIIGLIPTNCATPQAKVKTLPGRFGERSPMGVSTGGVAVLVFWLLHHGHVVAKEMV